MYSYLCWIFQKFLTIKFHQKIVGFRLQNEYAFLWISRFVFSSPSSVSPSTVSPSAAANMIKQLYKDDKNDKIYDKYDSYKHKDIVNKAFNIYNNVNTQTQHHLVINALVKLCVHFEITSKIFSIWNDIKNQCINSQSVIGYPLLIKCCIKSKKFEKGKELHQILSKSMKMQQDIPTQNALIDMYGYFGDYQNALKIFNSIPDHIKTDITIGTMIRSYIKSNKYDQAMIIYEKYSSSLKNDIYIKGMLIHHYQNINDVENAYKIFSSIDKDKMEIACIGCMMQTYCNANMNTECIDLFQNIHNINDKLKPDILCYITVVTACTQATAYQFGSKIHNDLKNNINGNQWMLSELRIQISLIHLYGKCGMMDKCLEILNDIKINENEKYRNEAWIWGSIIKSYGRNGDVIKAKETFNKMKYELKLKPDQYTYLSLIHSCNHSGNIDEANNIWMNEIGDDYNIKYDKYIISSMVDGLSRKGQLIKAKQLIDEYERYTKNQYHESMWISLLSACKKYKNLIMAEEVNKAIKIRFPENEKYMASSSVLLSNTYSYFGDYDKCNQIWNEMKDKGWKKQPGISEIDIYGKIHKFYAGYKYRKVNEYKIIDQYLEQLFIALQTNYDYKPDWRLLTKELDDNETGEDRLLRHGEKLALIYGLLTTPKHYLLVINKNLRICQDCHTFIKLTSLFKNRKVIVSDLNRVHVFEHGECSCNDYY